MQATQSRSRVLAHLALTVALMALCAWIAIPTAVPFTLQTFAVFVTLVLLGGRLGTAAIVCYLALGLVGLPVFAGFTGGVGMLLGPTGGYLLGFPLMGLSYWALTARFGEGRIVRALALLTALLLLYAFGSFWFLFFYLEPGGMGLLGVLTYCVFPFIVPDLLKLALALFIADRVKPQLRLN